MDIIESLHAIGLTKTETTLYTYLLEHHHATPPQIARGTGIARTNCYQVLGSLCQQGLIREETGSTGRKLYFANDPEALLRSAQNRANAIEQILPDMRAMFAATTNKPVVRFYDGLSEIQNVYRSSLDAEEVFALGSTARLSQIMPEFIAWYFTQLSKRRVILHDIVSPLSQETTKKISSNLLQSYFPHILPKKFGDIPTDILVWNDSVALIILTEPYFATVLSHPALAQTFRMLWTLINERLA